MERKAPKSVADKEDNLKIYEVGFLLLPTISEDRLGEETTKVKASVEDNGGFPFLDEFPKIRDLGYTMYKKETGKKSAFDKAYFGWIKFRAEPQAVIKIKESLDKNENILRLLVIETIKEVPVAPHKNVLGGVRAKKVKEEAESAPAISEEEVDKAIEDLVIE